MNDASLHAVRWRLPDGWEGAWRAFQLWSARFQVRFRRPVRDLQLREKLALGEKCFVAVLCYQERRFLISGSASSVALLAEVSAGRAFADMLARIRPEGIAR